jgi:hypothetical protein
MGLTARDLLSRRRQRQWIRFAKSIFGTIILVAICAAIWTARDKIDISPTLKLLNENNGTLAAVATVVLVAITAFYTYATFKLVSVTAEIRNNQIRPLFKISKLKLVDVEKVVGTKEYTEFKFEFEMVNFAPSPAINARMHGVIPILNSHGKIENQLQTPVAPDLPLVLHQNDIFKGHFSLHVEHPDLKAYAVDFLELELHYEDVDMNYYYHLESYWLDSGFGDKPKFYFLHNDYEGLRILYAKERTFIADTRRRWWFGESHVIFERTRLPWQTLARTHSS